MGKKTQVYEYHRQHGNIVDYAGFDLPVWFEGIIPECKSVRTHAGIFDVSHMGRVLVEGNGAESFLNSVTTNNVSGLAAGEGQYSLLCNPRGGIMDDLTVFKLDSARFLLVYNAANRDKDWNWLQHNRGHHEVALSDVSDDVAMFAVQGPNAGALLRKASGDRLDEIDKYGTRESNVSTVPCLITRSGYTGEDGFEIYVWKASISDPAKAVSVWNTLLDQGKEFGLRPAGLGARDVLRLEAGMCLYGNDMDEETSPTEVRLGWVVRMEKGEFVGRDAIRTMKASGPDRVRIGFRMREKGIPRQGQEIFSNGGPVGKVTSGTFSPTLLVGVGMGFVLPQLSGLGEKLRIRVRDRSIAAEVVRLPFYQRRSGDRVVVFGEEMGIDEFRTESGFQNPE